MLLVVRPGVEVNFDERFAVSAKENHLYLNVILFSVNNNPASSAAELTSPDADRRMMSRGSDSLIGYVRLSTSLIWLIMRALH